MNNIKVNNINGLLLDSVYMMNRTRLLPSLKFSVRLLKINDVSMRTKVHTINRVSTFGVIKFAETATLPPSFYLNPQSMYITYLFTAALV